MSTFLTQYQSANLSDEQIIDNFVVRTKEFERVMADIRTTDKNSSFQHYVFVGRRGSGKSTLLRRIQAEVETDDELKPQFIVTNLSEEQAGVYKLYDLWDYVMRDLRAKGFELPIIDWQQYQDDLKEYTKVLYRAIHDFLQLQDKRLILLVDNIDRIFKNIGKDASLLREQLMNFNDVRIIGGSTVMAEDFWQYDKPFYQFFSIKRLEPLTMDEIKMLLEHWAVVRGNPEIAKFVERHPGKIQAVRMLTDGTPRTMQLFVDMLINRDDQQGFDYLRRIIDNATPIYQERLAQLSHQQQKIVTELSFFWEAASVEQLVPVCKMSGKNISAQMAQLVKARIVEKVKGEKKNMYYRLEERFFNLWLLVTQGGPTQKKEAKYLTVFLEAWYDKEGLEFVCEEFMGNLDAGGLKPDFAILMTKALAHSKLLNWAQRDSLIDKLREKGNLSHLQLQEIPEKVQEIIPIAFRFLDEKKTSEALELLNSIMQGAGYFHYTSVLYLLNQENVGPDEMRVAQLVISDALDQHFDPGFLTVWFIDRFYTLNIGKEEVQLILLRHQSNFGPNPILYYYYASITSLWVGDLVKFSEVSKNIFPEIFDLGSYVNKFLTELMVHKQYNRVLFEFQEGNYRSTLRKLALPQLYAVFMLTTTNYQEIERMPPELTQVVSDIVAKVKERQEFYYGK
jgi:AAA ATPase domain